MKQKQHLGFAQCMHDPFLEMQEVQLKPNHVDMSDSVSHVLRYSLGFTSCI